jgi:hypothetical protein
MSHRKRRHNHSAQGDVASTKTTTSATVPLGNPKKMRAADLDDRKTRGALLAAGIGTGACSVDVLDEERAIYWSAKDGTRAYTVSRDIRNRRGTLAREYRCSCPDFQKNGRTDCEHIFCERIRRSEVVVEGAISAARAASAKATRRPARVRHATDGRSIRSAQRAARERMPDNIDRLIVSLRKAYDLAHTGSILPPDSGRFTPLSVRATTLLHKVVNAKSADEIRSVFGKLIESRELPLASVPHRNTLTEWINDPLLTPVLRDFLFRTAYPFRRREVGAIIDSSKLSQMRSAHSRWVDYHGDTRSQARWMKCHAIVGVETMVAMSVEFSDNAGEGSADVNFAVPLVREAVKAFGLHFLLADKAYFSKDLVRWLSPQGIRAVIPVKKNITRPGMPADSYDPYVDLISWYDEHQQDFHSQYRLRPKVEGFFSAMKRAAQDFCWSRGRQRQSAIGGHPCTAWVNEALCKFIFMNLRTTTTLEEETGVSIDYLTPDRHFPSPIEPLLRAA